MAGVAVAAAVDAFMATAKIVLGADRPVSWADGHSPNEKVISSFGIAG